MLTMSVQIPKPKHQDAASGFAEIAGVSTKSDADKLLAQGLRKIAQRNAGRVKKAERKKRDREAKKYIAPFLILFGVVTAGKSLNPQTNSGNVDPKLMVELENLFGTEVEQHREHPEAHFPVRGLLAGIENSLAVKRVGAARTEEETKRDEFHASVLRRAVDMAEKLIVSMTKRGVDDEKHDTGGEPRPPAGGVPGGSPGSNDGGGTLPPTAHGPGPNGGDHTSTEPKLIKGPRPLPPEELALLPERIRAKVARIKKKGLAANILADPHTGDELIPHCGRYFANLNDAVHALGNQMSDLITALHLYGHSKADETELLNWMIQTTVKPPDEILAFFWKVLDWID